MNTKHILNDLLPAWEALACDTELSALVDKRDVNYVRRRTQAEGLDFLTVQLPMLGKALDLSFQTGVLKVPDGYSCCKGQSVPVFLNKAFRVLFEDNGTLKCRDLDPLTFSSRDMFANAAKAIRQLTLMYYKMETPYSDSLITDTVATFVKTEEELTSMLPAIDSAFEASNLEQWDHYFQDRVLTRARLLVHLLLGGVNPLEIEPRHGSGASACGTPPWDRYKRPRWIPRLAKVFPYDEYFFTDGSLCDNLAEYLSEGDYEPVAKVVLVPKDSRGPRLISEEPRETMYIQQGLMALMYERINALPGVRSMLSCQDQGRNRSLALYGSETGEYATLDLKDASDRVSTVLVKRLFPRNWVNALFACRCEWTELPDGRKFPLNGKFAPMGSACCFPVEAICFWALALATILVLDEEHYHTAYYPLDVFSVPCGDVSDRVVAGGTVINKPKLLKQHAIRRRAWVPGYIPFHGEWVGKPLIRLLNCNQFDVRTPVSVYGDDIIVPTWTAKFVVGILERVGLKVNKSKSFTGGPFRESCGGDYLLGRDVSIVKFKKPVVKTASASQKPDVNVMYSAFRTRDLITNMIAKYGDYESLVQRLTEWFENLYGDALPLTLAMPRGIADDASPRGLVVETVTSDSMLQPYGIICPRCGSYCCDVVLKGQKPKAQCCGYVLTPRSAIGITRTNPRLHRREVLTVVERPIDIKIDNGDWCHVLRSLSSQGGLKGTSVVTLAKRNSYNLGWVNI